MEATSWLRSAGGTLSFEDRAFLLLVKEVSGAMRYLVFWRRADDRATPPELFGSGTADNVRLAMTGAGRMAERGHAIRGAVNP